WREAVEHLTSLQFITLENESLETVLVIRKDTYFEKVITDYQAPYRDLIRLQRTLEGLKDAEALSNLGVALYVQKQYEDAISTYDLALAFDSKQANTLNNKGA